MKDNNGLNILLIQPPLPANHRHKKVVPLGLAYISSYLRMKIQALNIEILDALVLNLNYTETVKEIFKAKRDVVGITFWTAQAPFAYNLATAIKQWSPETIVIFGGVHTTCFPEEAIRFADYCVLHEGEETFFELIQRIRDKRNCDEIKGIAFSRGGVFFRSSDRPFISNLDDIPFPAWDLLPIQRYDTQLHLLGGQRMPVIGSRGCPYNCSFCVSPNMWKREVRWRDPENVVLEMKAVAEQYGIIQFHFWDDNLLMNKEYIKRLCTRIIDYRLNIKWIGLTRASHITSAGHELLKLISDSGCIGLEIGIESVDPNTFSNIHKEENIEDLEKAGRLQREAGMYPLYTYMSLNPGENITTYYLQARFIDKLLSGLPWCEHFHPLPFPVYIGQFCTPHIGTELYKEAKNLGKVLADSWSEYNHHTINFVPYSLLNDIPQKTIKHLREDDYIICVKAAWYWMYDLYPYKEPMYYQALKQYGFLCFLSEFFIHCNGYLTVKEIAEKLHNNSGVNLKKSIQYSIIIIIVLSQLGVVRSALFNPGLKVDLKTIRIPRQFQTRWRYRFLRWIVVINKFFGR